MKNTKVIPTSAVTQKLADAPMTNLAAPVMLSNWSGVQCPLAQVHTCNANNNNVCGTSEKTAKANFESISTARAKFLMTFINV
jgi:hypothetical protein